jgi:hypothetical protein
VDHLAYRGRGRAPFLVAGLVAAVAPGLLLGAVGCTAGVRMSSAGSGGSGNTIGQGGSGGSLGTGGHLVVTGEGGGGGDVFIEPDAGFNPDAMACQTKSVAFTPTQPTVFVLVDQSGSEFTNATTGTFFTLRTAVLQVIQNLQGTVRFGVGAFTGDQGTSPKMCPIWTTVAPALNNYAAINTVYSGLGQPSFKAETPAVQVIPLIQQTLASDTTNGPKFILFATDSETDFCDDGDPDCPADAVTYELQSLYQGTPLQTLPAAPPSIGTLVIGLAYTGNNIAGAVLQNFANAGAGMPVALPTGNGTTTTMQLYYACNGQGMNAGNYSWPNLYTAAGHAAADLTSIATYTAAGGTAPVYTPSGADTQSLITQISAALDTIPPSCTFDLTTFKIDLTRLSEAGVLINGALIPLDPNNINGWDMVSPTELQLFGSACQTLQTPNADEKITFDFPCDIVIDLG